MVKSRGLPTIGLPADVARAIEEFIASGALQSPVPIRVETSSN
jgi:hypothetical protein